MYVRRGAPSPSVSACVWSYSPSCVRCPLVIEGCRQFFRPKDSKVKLLGLSVETQAGRKVCTILMAYISTDVHHILLEPYSSVSLKDNWVPTIRFNIVSTCRERSTTTNSVSFSLFIMSTLPWHHRLSLHSPSFRPRLPSLHHLFLLPFRHPSCLPSQQTPRCNPERPGSGCPL